MNISVVFPCYNEWEHIYNNMIEAKRQLDKEYWTSHNFEFLVVDDWSKDNTLSEILRLEKDTTYVKALSYWCNKWKWFAVRFWVSRATWEIISFLDSDLDISPQYLIKQIDFLIENQNYDMVIGNKNLEWSSTNRWLKRKILSFVSKTINSVLFTLPFSDTQVWLKTFRSPIKDLFVKYVFTHWYAFDVEVLFFVKLKKHPIKELPVAIEETVARTSIWMKAMLTMLLELFIFFRRTIIIYRFNRWLINKRTWLKILFLKYRIFPFERMLAKILKDKKKITNPIKAI